MGLLASGAILAGIAGSAHGSPELPNPELTITQAHALIHNLHISAPAEQKAALENESVSMDEYRAAIENSRECIRQTIGSVDVSPAQASDDSYQLGFYYTISDPEVARSADPNVGKNCYERFVKYVEGAYQAEKKADSGYVEGVARDMAACLHSAGVGSMSDTAPATVLQEAVGIIKMRSKTRNAAADACIERYPAVLSVVGS